MHQGMKTTPPPQTSLHRNYMMPYVRINTCKDDEGTPEPTEETLRQ